MLLLVLVVLILGKRFIIVTIYLLFLLSLEFISYFLLDVLVVLMWCRCF